MTSNFPNQFPFVRITSTWSLPMLQPGSATAKLTVPLGAMLPSMPDIAPAEVAPPPPSTPPKPKWQETLDRALITVGRFSERRVHSG